MSKKVVLITGCSSDFVIKPKLRYHITEATSILAFLKRFLPTKLLDKILLKIT